MTEAEKRDEMVQLLAADVIGAGGVIACIEQMADEEFITPRDANRLMTALHDGFLFKDVLKALIIAIQPADIDEAYALVVEETL